MSPTTADTAADGRFGWPASAIARPVIMGVLNVTPNSFSDGGHYAEHAAALERARQIEAEGADILDIGGESTHPKAEPVNGDTEQARVIPVIERLASTLSIPISIDTYRSQTAAAGLQAGAKIVNDVWGLQKDPEMAAVVASAKAGVCVMHNRATIEPDIDIVADAVRFLERSLTIAVKAGIAEDAIVIDPGIGFGKTFDQNLAVIARLGELTTLGRPILLGASRKGFIGAITGKAEPSDRLQGTLAAHAAAVLNGAEIIRAHDVAAHRDVLAVAFAVRQHRRAA